MTETPITTLVAHHLGISSRNLLHLTVARNGLITAVYQQEPGNDPDWVYPPSTRTVHWLRPPA